MWQPAQQWHAYGPPQQPPMTGPPQLAQPAQQWHAYGPPQQPMTMGPQAQPAQQWHAYGPPQQPMMGPPQLAQPAQQWQAHEGGGQGRSRGARSRSRSHSRPAVAKFPDDDSKLSAVFKALGSAHRFGKGRVTPHKFRCSLITACDSAQWPMLLLSQVECEKIDMLLYCLTGLLPTTKTSAFGVSSKGEARQAVHDMYKARLRRNPDRLNTLSPDMENIPEVAMRLGYPRSLCSVEMQARIGVGGVTGEYGNNDIKGTDAAGVTAVQPIKDATGVTAKHPTSGESAWAAASSAASDSGQGSAVQLCLPPLRPVARGTKKTRGAGNPDVKVVTGECEGNDMDEVTGEYGNIDIKGTEVTGIEDTGISDKQRAEALALASQEGMTGF